MQNLYKLQKRDKNRAVEVLKDAFRVDPFMIKLFDGESNVDQKQIGFYEIPVLHCLKFGEIYSLSENLQGICAFSPGEYADVTIWRSLKSGALRSLQKMGTTFTSKIKKVYTPINNNRNRMMSGQPYYYLNIIGVAADKQGQGLGGKLLTELVKRCDKDKRQLYLETETKTNVKFYEKFGFQVKKELIVPVIHQPIWEMVRE